MISIRALDDTLLSFVAEKLLSRKDAGENVCTKERNFIQTRVVKVFTAIRILHVIAFDQNFLKEVFFFVRCGLSRFGST